MPYHIIKVKGGFKVQSQNGTLLSNKPLTRERAEKQLIAANLSYIRSKK